MSNPFAILADYPDNGPAMPQREKVHRQKDKHDPGTGRRDKEKRQGRGPSNWGNPMDDVTHPAVPDQQENVEEGAENEQQQQAPKEEVKPYVSASQFFEDSDSDETPAGVPQKPKKLSYNNVPKEYADLIVEKKEKHIQNQRDEDEDEKEDNELQTGFLSTKEAIQQRRDNSRFESRGRGRGGPRGRGGRGGRGGHYGGPRGGADGENRPRGGGHPRGRGQRQFQHYEDRLKEQGQQGQPEGERKPQRDQNRGPRDKRPGNVQHQRDNSNRGQRQQRQNLNLNDFPSLH